MPGHHINAAAIPLETGEHALGDSMHVNEILEVKGPKGRRGSQRHPPRPTAVL